MITEVYVSIDNLEFTKLDLHKDEAINLKQTQKDLQDISKIFSPHSLNFTFPVTAKNQIALGYFGDTKVIKINPDNKYYLKYYSGGMLDFEGFLTLKSISYKNNAPENFMGGFITSMTDLKTRIGEDTINDLATVMVDWSPKKVYSLMQGGENQTFDGTNISYFVPLISNNRVLSYDSTFSGLILDNIAYNPANAVDSIDLLKTNELRPNIYFSSVMDLIIKKYNLDINCPLFSRNEYKDLTIYANNEKIITNLEKKLTIKSTFWNYNLWRNQIGVTYQPPLPYSTIVDFYDSSFKIIKQIPVNNPLVTINYNNYCDFFIDIYNILFTASSSLAPNVTIRLKNKTTGITFKAQTFPLTTNTRCFFSLENSLFISNELDFYITAEFNQPCVWTNITYDSSCAYTGLLNTDNNRFSGEVYQQSEINNNSLDFGATNIDIFKMLPSTKVTDFLQSFFKLFNISVFDVSPNNERLNWLTPGDIQTTGLAYSKARVDYTRYADISSVVKSTASDYNYFDFKHLVSKYKSNYDYQLQTGLEYGQATYPAIKPVNANQFIVQTAFSIIPPVHINGTIVPTFYAFTKDAPEILDSGHSRYKPNYNELTLFYSHGIQPLGIDVGVQSQTPANVLTNSKISTHIKVMPFSKQNYSLAFSNIVFDYVEYVESIFKVYYANQIIRLLNPNVLSQTYTLQLPSSELYVNEATTIQGGGKTPSGFRLQNEVIIGEYLFTIIDSNIDITTGKAKLTLLNF